MANTISIDNAHWHSKLSGELDKMIVAKAATGFFGDGGFGAKFQGAKTVLIDDVTMSGLGDYDRETGFPKGTVTIGQTPYTLTMERGTSFTIDRLDAEETGVENLPGKLGGNAGEFVRTQVVPEVDAYAISKLFGIASSKSHFVADGTALENNSVKILTDAINKVADAYGEDEDLIAFCNSDFYADLMNTTELTRRLDISDFKKGEVDTKIKNLNGCKLIKVQSARMKTAYEFKTGDGDVFGFAPTGEAKNIGCIVLPRQIVNRVMKVQKCRYWTPDQNLDMDAYKLDFRFVYDFLVKKSAQDCIYAYSY